MRCIQCKLNVPYNPSRKADSPPEACFFFSCSCRSRLRASISCNPPFFFGRALALFDSGVGTVEEGVWERDWLWEEGVEEGEDFWWTMSLVGCSNCFGGSDPDVAGESKALWFVLIETHTSCTRFWPYILHASLQRWSYPRLLGARISRLLDGRWLVWWEWQCDSF